jgi:hypothetical protein
MSKSYAQAPVHVGVYVAAGGRRRVQMDAGGGMITFPIEDLPELLRVLEHVVHKELPDRPAPTPFERLEQLERRALQLQAGFERLDQEIHNQGNRVAAQILRLDGRTIALEEKPDALRALVELETKLHLVDMPNAAAAVRAARVDLEAIARHGEAVK